MLIATLRAKYPRFAPLRYAEARTYLVRRRWSEAARKLEAVSPELATSGMTDMAHAAMFYAGTAYEQLESFDQALAAYNGATAIQPDRVPSRFRAATMLASLGRLDDAITAYRRLPPDTPGFRSAIVRVKLAQNARLAPAEQKWGDVDALLSEMRADGTDSGSLTQITVEVLIARRQFAEARTLIQKFRDEHPDRPAVALVLATLLQAEGKPDEALATIDAVQTKSGDIAAIRIARSRYWATRGGKEAPTALASLHDGLDKFTQEEQADILAGLASATFRIGNRGGSSEDLDASVARAPTSLPLRRRQLAMAFQSGRDETILPIIKEIRKIEGESGVHWRVAEANRLVRLAKTLKSPTPLKEARVLATEAVAIRKDMPEGLLTLAELDDAENNRVAAITNYQKVVDAGVRSPVVLERLGTLQAARGQFRDANSTFRMIEPQPPGGTNLTKLMAEVAVFAKDDARGEALVRSAVPADSKVVADLIWQARFLAQLKQGPEAEAVVRRAIALEPGSTASRMMLVQLLIASGAKPKAEAEAAAAIKALPPGSEVEHAQLAAMVGRPPGAPRRRQHANSRAAKSARQRFLRAGQTPHRVFA